MNTCGVRMISKYLVQSILCSHPLRLQLTDAAIIRVTAAVTPPSRISITIIIAAGALNTK